MCHNQAAAGYHAHYCSQAHSRIWELSHKGAAQKGGSITWDCNGTSFMMK